MLIKTLTAKRGLYRCDNLDCSKEHVRLFSRSRTKTHPCSRECQFLMQKRGGKINEACRATCRKIYGTDSPTQSDLVKQKTIQNCFEKHGVSHHMLLSSVQDKIKNTNIERYGVVNVFQSETHKEKIQNTMIERYGAPHALQVLEFQEKFKATNRERYGCDYSGGRIEAIEKQKQTNMKKFGSSCSLHGIHPLTGEKVYKHRTGRHTLERKFLDDLYEIFGIDDVSWQIPVWYSDTKCWNIDYYVQSLDLFIEHDGVYWQGLNRKIEDINQSTSVRDQTIKLIPEKNKLQNEWFKEQNILLVRVLDVEVKQWRKEKKMKENLMMRLLTAQKTFQQP